MQELKKGTLTKINEVWLVKHNAESAGDNHMWVNLIPVKVIHNSSPFTGDAMLSWWLQVEVKDLEGQEVYWKYTEDGNFTDYSSCTLHKNK